MKPNQYRFVSRRQETQWVKAGEHGWIDIKGTEFIDIEEGQFGDEYIFNLPGSEEEFRSQIISGSQPG
jgi:hypothetical protein